MHKDVRYKAVRDLIKTNSITEFGQIFDTLPKTVIAKVLRKNTNRIDDLMDHPEELRYKEIKMISSFLDVPCSMVIRLFDKEFS